MDKERTERILLAHGSGGSMSRALVEELFLRAFDNPILSHLDDQAIFDSPHSKIAFTTDSYVVSPIFFPGGDIGKLSVCGTINDLAVGGARPLYMSASFIIEEGMDMDELRSIVHSMAETAASSGVEIVTGDTKVVERGKADKVFINTTGVGVIKDGIDLSPSRIKAGDAIVVSGTMGDHGMAIMAHREGIQMEIPIESDCAPLHGLIQELLSECGDSIHAMRDPTRGGLATILNEFSHSCNLAMLIREVDVPVREEVRGACEILGFDPLYLANEGKVVVICSRDSAHRVVEIMRQSALGRNAALIGEVLDEPRGKVLLETTVGNRRILDMLAGEQLPRIC